MLSRIQINTDCEGPLTLDDNAFEIAREVIPDGDRFFKQVSAYDDYLADIAHKEGYKAGDTLKLIVPWLKAGGLTNRRLADYSRAHIHFVPHAQEAVDFLKASDIDIFMVSTSYKQYAEAAAETLGMSAKHVYSTELDLDSLPRIEAECRELEEWRQEIASRDAIELPAGAKELNDLSPSTQKTILLMDDIFWSELARLKMGRPLSVMNPVGGREKAKSVDLSLKTSGRALKEVMFVGDSITDVQALEAVKQAGGLAVSFNGNRYAVEACEIALISDSVATTALLADIFNRQNREAVIALAENCADGKNAAIGDACAAAPELKSLLQNRRIEIYPVTPANKDMLVKRSSAFRKELRGAIIGGLG